MTEQELAIRLDNLQHHLQQTADKLEALEREKEQHFETLHGILHRESIKDIKQALRDGDGYLLTEEQLFALEGWDNADYETGPIDSRILKAEEYSGKTWQGLGEWIRKRKEQRRIARESA
jgi:hypothetical protein